MGENLNKTLIFIQMPEEKKKKQQLLNHLVNEWINKASELSTYIYTHQHTTASQMVCSNGVCIRNLNNTKTTDILYTTFCVWLFEMK